MKQVLLILLLGMASLFAADTPPARALLYMDIPIVHSVEPAHSEAIAHALRYHLERTGRFLVPTAEEQELQPATAKAWHLAWSLERQDTLLVLSLALRSPDTGKTRRIQKAAPAGATADEIVGSAVRLLFVPPDSVPPPLASAKPRHLWVPGLFWAGFAATLWQQDAFNRQDPNDASPTTAGSGHASAGIAGFFTGLPPLPLLRGTGGAGSARHGQPGIQSLNPAGVANSNAQLEIAAASLPGGTSEAYGAFASPCGGGLWQSHSLRYEGDSLARAWLFTSSLALQLDYWFPWLSGARAGLSLKGTSLALGTSQNPDAATGNGLGWGMDLGLQWQLASGIALGTSLLDIVAMNRYTNTLTNRNYWERTPPRWILGVAWNAPYETQLLADWTTGLDNDWEPALALGLEKELGKFATWKAGYRQLQNGNSSTWHTGIGAHAKAGSYTLQLDYAYEIPSQPGSWTNSRQTIGTRLLF